jgi:hypothetical protein
MTTKMTPPHAGEATGHNASRRTGRPVLRALAAPLALAGGLAVATPLVLAPVASAQPSLAAYSLTPLTVTITVNGDTVIITVSGGGFPANITITLTFASTPFTLGHTQTDAQGNFTFTGPLPAGLVAGQHTVTASGGGLSGADVVPLSASLPGVVAATPAATSTTLAGTAGTTTASSPSSTNLAFTGTDVTLTAAGGALLIGGGGVLVISSRKRKQKAWSL